MSPIKQFCPFHHRRACSRWGRGGGSISSCACQTSSLISARPPGAEPRPHCHPAASMRPKPMMQAFTMAATEALSVTSH